MKNTLPHLFIVALCALVLGHFSVQAGDVKFPADTVPAFSFTMPDDWTQMSSKPNIMIVRSGDHFCAITLGISTGAVSSLDDLHKTVFTTGKVEDSNKSEPVELGGKKGTAYYGSNVVNGGTIDVKLIIVHVDDNHVAFANIISARVITPTSKAAVDKVLQSIKFVETK